MKDLATDQTCMEESGSVSNMYGRGPGNERVQTGPDGTERREEEPERTRVEKGSQVKKEGDRLCLQSTWILLIYLFLLHVL
ncbi:hypothetical protein TNCT_68271 [Trichonephila clavata]|uniref:Uncharacterized protein n=1 Tax=Trichonephila clavata TaxID=2740835 RepID=A0A8X6FIS5_TRICU|nr:hypothetical protein TNCT_68271 [Trichonephila clavata]